MESLISLRDIFYPNSLIKSLAIQTQSLYQGIYLTDNKILPYPSLRPLRLFPLMPELSEYFFLCNSIKLDLYLLSSITIPLFPSDIFEVTTALYPQQTLQVIFLSGLEIKKKNQDGFFFTNEIYCLKLIKPSPYRSSFMQELHLNPIREIVNSHHQHDLKFVTMVGRKWTGGKLMEYFTQLYGPQNPSIYQEPDPKILGETLSSYTQKMGPLCSEKMEIEDILFKSLTTLDLLLDENSNLGKDNPLPYTQQLQALKKKWLKRRDLLTTQLQSKLPLTAKWENSLPFLLSHRF